MIKEQWGGLGMISLGVSVVSFIMAGYKFFAYENSYSGYISRQVNAYVGSDAHNYIINSNYTTAFLVAGIGFLIVGILCMNMEVAMKKNEILEEHLKEMRQHLGISSQK